VKVTAADRYLASEPGPKNPLIVEARELPATLPRRRDDGNVTLSVKRHIGGGREHWHLRRMKFEGS